MKLSRLFLPHPETNKKAHLISPWALAVYLVLFVFLQGVFNTVALIKPGVLGVSSNIDQHALIDLTNSERAKNGLPPLKENSELDAAAAAKAQNMFAENYWAHYAPSGKTPWDFIKAAGYGFNYAGENLARNFTNSPDVMVAWMNSPTHKANIVNSHYQDIGIAVVDGTLLGQKTTLVVQEFGTPVEAVAQAPKATEGPQISQSAPNIAAAPLNNAPQTLGVPATVPSKNLSYTQGTPNQPLFDPFAFSKDFGLVIISMIIALLLIDFLVVRKRAVVKLSARTLPHLALLTLAGTTLLNMHPGSIL